MQHSLSEAALSVGEQPLWVLDSFSQLVVLCMGGTPAPPADSLVGLGGGVWVGGWAAVRLAVWMVDRWVAWEHTRQGLCGGPGASGANEGALSVAPAHPVGAAWLPTRLLDHPARPRHPLPSSPLPAQLLRTLAGIRASRRCTPEVLILHEGQDDTSPVDAWLLEDAVGPSAGGGGGQQPDWPSFVDFLNAATRAAQRLLPDAAK